MRTRIFNSVLLIQVVYTLFTAVWALVNVKSFMEVSGYKTDIWLVKTVSVLLIAISCTLFLYLFIRINRFPAVILAFLLALGLLCIDVYYALFTKEISDIYLLDGVLQFLFIISWVGVMLSKKSGRITAENIQSQT